MAKSKYDGGVFIGLNSNVQFFLIRQGGWFDFIEGEVISINESPHLIHEPMEQVQFKTEKPYTLYIRFLRWLNRIRKLYLFYNRFK